MNTCGECSLCCKLLRVENLTEEGEWCKHCNPGKGCRIYDDRPEPCRRFMCHWITSDFGEQYRPDKTHIVVAGESPKPIDAWIIHIDSAFPRAYKDNKNTKRYLAALQRDKHPNLVLVRGSKRTVITEDMDLVTTMIDKLKENWTHGKLPDKF